MVVTADTDIRDLVARALEQTGAVIAAIPAGLAGAPTPCPAWDVRALVRHIVAQDLRNFIVSARGETADWQAPADEIGEDWAAATTADYAPAPSDPALAPRGRTARGTGMRSRSRASTTSPPNAAAASPASRSSSPDPDW